MKKKHNPKENAHAWQFFRAGGFDQVRIDSARDLLALDQLDQKLWVALSCSITNVYFDQKTLSMIDTDKDGRIRAPELIAAIKWAGRLLKNPDDLVPGGDGISVNMINDSSDEGKILADSVKRSLKTIGKNESEMLTLADVQVLEKAFSVMAFNGDGIITEDSTGDETLKGIIREIIATTGSLEDRSGKSGIDLTKLESFFSQLSQYYTWLSEMENLKYTIPCRDKAVDPFGAVEAILAVKDKINDYFLRCAIAEFDDNTADLFNGIVKKDFLITGKTLSEDCQELAGLPLATIKKYCPLPLSTGLNPAWTKKMAIFKSIVVNSCLGERESLSLSDWNTVLAIFEPLISWKERKPVHSFDHLDKERISILLTGTVKEQLFKLIELDNSEKTVFSTINDLEKLIRLRRDLYKLSINFVNFKDFYSKGEPAIFQAGTLYLDQRSCHLCIKVDNPDKHSLTAAMAGTYLAYCECKRKGDDGKITIVAAFTSGDSENLMVGRNGVFYDRYGKDWDATIIKIIDNPISITQAFWQPYKGLVRLIESQVAKRAMDAQTQSSQKLSEAANTAVNADKIRIEPLQQPKKLDVGIVAALGVAAGALGTFIATLLGYISGIIKLGPLAIVGSIVGLIALISAPSIILAYIKLRKRNLGPILDASGWAINGRARINVPFGAMLTHVATMPPGSHRDITDPYAEKKSPWPKLALIGVLLYLAFSSLNHLGYIDYWSGGLVGIKRNSLPHTIIIGKKTSTDSSVPINVPSK